MRENFLTLTLNPLPIHGGGNLLPKLFPITETFVRKFFAAEICECSCFFFFFCYPMFPNLSIIFTMVPAMAGRPGLPLHHCYGLCVLYNHCAGVCLCVFDPIFILKFFLK